MEQNDLGKIMSEINYSTQTPQRFIDNLALKKRLTMLELFLKEFPSHSFDQVLDVGVTADRNALSSNYFEKYFPEKNKIIALSNQNASFLEKVYPGITFQCGDARKLPFTNDSIDIIFSSAVIEHVGSLEDQTRMIAECVRVAKRGIFITTPNRWHPIEVHTLLPLIHWLPKKLHRAILKTIGLGFFSYETNLNLLDQTTLQIICKKLSIKNFSIKQVKTCGVTSNLILVIKK